MTDPTTLAHLDRAAARADRRLGALARADAALSRVRLALGVGLAAAVTAVFTTEAQTLGLAAAGVLLAAFVWAARRHARVVRAQTRWRAWRQIRLDRSARARRAWDQILPPLDLRPPPDHPFAADLNTLGPRSLHHLVDAAATDAGRRRLAEWMLTTEPDAAEIAARRELVQELVEKAALRDRVALAARLAGGRVGTRALDALAEAPDRTGALQRALWITTALIVLTYALVALWALGLAPPVFVFGFLAYALVYVARFGDLAASFDDAAGLERSLRSLGALFAVAEAPQTGRVGALLAPFAASERPSALLRRVERTVTALAVRQNGLLWVLLNGLGPWDVWFTLRLARLEARIAGRLPVWLDAFATLDAAASLAEFADLNGYPFPVVSDEAPAVLTGTGLVHPLLPPGAAVPNSFTVERAVTIVTGSNMSGKSTFLRTLGANLVLAHAGGPVSAEALAVAPVRLHALLNVADSVQDGISYFYAEVRRMRQLLDAVEADDDRPVFFLIDEILRGTNNRERLEGSRAIIETLAGSERAAGVLSTHDLDLARIEGAAFRNVHFRDEARGDRMAFDYRLREGPSTTTNALRVMAAAGLPTGTGA